MQKSPLIGGFALSAMVLGWPVGATVGVRGFRRFGVRAVLRVGGALVPAGAVVFIVSSTSTVRRLSRALDRSSSVWGWASSAAPRSILIQEIVDWSSSVRKRDRVLSVRAQLSRQHVWGDGVRRGA